jgi:hypothetical protein
VKLSFLFNSENSVIQRYTSNIVQLNSFYIKFDRGQYRQMSLEINVSDNDGAIMYVQSRETANIGYTRHMTKINKTKIQRRKQKSGMLDITMHKHTQKAQ